VHVEARPDLRLAELTRSPRTTLLRASTASSPRGRGAPVMMRMQLPGWRASSSPPA
jgi:hypothetical protein